MLNNTMLWNVLSFKSDSNWRYKFSYGYAKTNTTGKIHLTRSSIEFCMFYYFLFSLTIDYSLPPFLFSFFSRILSKSTFNWYHGKDNLKYRMQRKKGKIPLNATMNRQRGRTDDSGCSLVLAFSLIVLI